MNLLILTSMHFPTFRPILISLWNTEFSNRGHNLFWIFDSPLLTDKVIKGRWKDSTIFILPSFGTSSYFSYVVNSISKFWLRAKISRHIIKNNKIDVFHSHDDSSLGLIGIINKFTFNIMTSFAYTAPFIQIKKKIAKEKFGLEFLVRYLFYLLTYVSYISVFRYSDILQPITDVLGKKLIKRYKIPKEKILVVGESVSTFFVSESDERLYSEQNQEIIYVGYMRKNRNLNFLLDTMVIVNEKFPNAKLSFLGWSDVEKDILDLKKYAKHLGVHENVIFLGFKPYKEVPKIILKSNIGLSPIPPIDIYMDSTPTKVVEYLSLGVPVVANKEIFDQSQLVKNSGGGFAVDYNKKAFANKIIYLLSNPSKAKRMGQRGREWVIRNRSFEKTAESIEKKYIDFLGV